MSSHPSATIGPDLRAALIAMVRKRVPESEVEDIVQSTLADAIQSPHAPKDSESLRRWIFGVAKNKVVDYHRRAKRETFEVPEVAGKPAPHAEADLLRWAEKHLPPGDENKTTLDWMLREGEGEKLEWIAETEQVPAPRVRQRVSRLRRHLKDHWQKEVALLATLGVLITIIAFLVRNKDPEPIANEDLPRAAELRKQAFEQCASASWKNCVDKLDEAKRLDPAGDTRPEVRLARDNASKALSLPPAPSPTTDNTTIPPTLTPPTPSAMPSGMPMPEPTGMKMKDSKEAPIRKPEPKNATPFPTGESTASPPPAPMPVKPAPIQKKGSSDEPFGSGGGTKGGGGGKSLKSASKTPGPTSVVDVSKAGSKTDVKADATPSKPGGPPLFETAGSSSKK